MIRDCEMLNTIRNTVQMGQIGIESVIPEAEDARFCATLRQQLAEYHEIRQEADGLLKQLGGKRKDPSGMAACCARMASKMKVYRDGTTSKIAEMMIEGNTKGMIKSIQNRHQYQSQDARVEALSRRLLDTELHNIEQMKPYL